MKSRHCGIEHSEFVDREGGNGPSTYRKRHSWFFLKWQKDIGVKN